MYGGMFSNFNGPTNVDLTKQYLVFDVDKTSISEDYLPAMMYIAFDCCYDLAKQSLKHKDAIFMDEVWLMMQNEDCAKQVKEMVKIIRGYGSCTVLATQDIGDFLRSNDGLGESILAASKIKFFLRIEDMEKSQACTRCTCYVPSIWPDKAFCLSIQTNYQSQQHMLGKGRRLLKP